MADERWWRCVVRSSGSLPRGALSRWSGRCWIRCGIRPLGSHILVRCAVSVGLGRGGGRGVRLDAWSRGGRGVQLGAGSRGVADGLAVLGEVRHRLGPIDRVERDGSKGVLVVGLRVVRPGRVAAQARDDQIVDGRVGLARGTVVVRSTAPAAALLPVDDAAAVAAPVAVTETDRDRQVGVGVVACALPLPLDLLPGADVDEVRVVRDEVSRVLPCPSLPQQTRLETGLDQRLPPGPTHQHGRALVDHTVSHVPRGLLGAPLHEPVRLVQEAVVGAANSRERHDEWVGGGVVALAEPGQGGLSFRG